MKILIVDDNADDRKLLKINLEQHGCEVIEAGDGEQGLAMAKTYKPGMIISDALMPHMDGFQFLRAVKTDDTLKTIPFVFYSAVYTGHDEARLAISLGAEAFMIKPKDPEEFWEEIIGILEECKLKKPNAITAELIKEEEDFLRKYSHIVAAKLEEKVKELEKAKDCAEESKRQYERLFDSSLDGIYSTDEYNRFLQVNSAFARIFGFDRPDEMIGKSALDFWADAEERKSFLQELKDKKGLAAYPVHARRRNGDELHIEISSNILEDENGLFLGIEGIVRDMTWHNKLEEQLRQSQKMEAIGTLAGGVAHDFNNILSAIIGYGSLTLMKMKEDDPLRNNIDQILDASQKATVLTQSLLAFSRKQPVNLTLLDLNELIRRFEKFLLRLLREDIELKIILNPPVNDNTTQTTEEITPPPSAPPLKLRGGRGSYDSQGSQGKLMVIADSGQIEQVLMNLTTNARDAMPASGKLTIETRLVVFEEEPSLYSPLEGGELMKGGKYALISVSDTGTGIDEKTKEKIFEPFFTTKEVGKGTGLGLAMVYGIIRKHEGYINVYSEKGYGTTFKIYLPIAKTISEPEEEEKAEELPLKGGTETVLVAEDDDSLRKLSTSVLRQFGYNVIEAVNGEEALNKFIENKDNIRLVILDGIMPKKNGKEAYDEMAVLRPDIKVIFMSGYSEDIFDAKSIEEKGLTYLLKPVPPTMLLKKIREALNK